MVAIIQAMKLLQGCDKQSCVDLSHQPRYRGPAWLLQGYKAWLLQGCNKVIIGVELELAQNNQVTTLLQS